MIKKEINNTVNSQSERFNPLNWPYILLKKDILFNIIIKGIPIAKGRPRMSKYGHVYTPSETSDHENMIAWEIKNIYKSKEADKKNKFGIRCIFYRPTRQRIDCDNLIKCVVDAISKTKIVWKDDNQCLEIMGRLFLRDPNPRTEFVVYKIEDETIKDYCKQCNKEIIKYNSTNRNYCSLICFSKSTRTEINCKNCNNKFTIPKSRLNSKYHKLTFCSILCSSKFYGKQKTITRGSHLWKCLICNGQVSRKEYKRCWECASKIKQKNGFTSNYWKAVKLVYK